MTSKTSSLWRIKIWSSVNELVSEPVLASFIVAATAQIAAVENGNFVVFSVDDNEIIASNEL